MRRASEQRVKLFLMHPETAVAAVGGQAPAAYPATDRLGTAPRMIGCLAYCQHHYMLHLSGAMALICWTATTPDATFWRSAGSAPVRVQHGFAGFW